MNYNIKNYFSNIKLLSKDSKFFPKNLLVLPDCPEILFVLGNETILNKPSISIVGTRNSSKQGDDIAFGLSKDISTYNINIISGLAKRYRY